MEPEFSLSIWDSFFLSTILLVLVSPVFKSRLFMAFAMVIALVTFAVIWWSSVGFPPALNQSPFVCSGAGADELLCGNAVIEWGTIIMAGLGTLVGLIAVPASLYLVWLNITSRSNKSKRSRGVQ